MMKFLYILRSAFEKLQTMQKKKRFQLFFVGFFTIIVFIVVLLVKESQDIRQRASEHLLGDFNDDGIVNILDYNIFSNCYGQKADTTSCTMKASADLDHSNLIDGVDYNIFIRTLVASKNNVLPTSVQGEPSQTMSQQNDDLQQLLNELESSDSIRASLDSELGSLDADLNSL